MTQQQPDSQQEVFVARQPILDGRKGLYAYELLYRASRDNVFPNIDSTEATSSLINSAMLEIGLGKLVAGRPAFINFDQKMLVSGYAHLLPKASVIIEILEDVVPDDEVLEACRALKAEGYRLALDDCVSETTNESLLNLVDIIKVDFLGTNDIVQQRFARKFGHSDVKLLAEKVETHDEFTQARDMGYDFFQGYFFSKPVIIEGRQIPGFKLNHLRVLQEVNRPEVDFNRVGDVVKHEPGLVHKLLRYVNSAGLARRTEIRSIQHALALLGELEIRKWFSLVALSGLASDKPHELVVSSVIRGRTCEMLAPRFGLAPRASELFLMGMFSLVDAVLDKPMEEIIRDVHLADDIREVLLSSPDSSPDLQGILDLAVAYEKADWESIEKQAATAAISLQTVMETCHESVEWADSVFRG